MTDARTPAPHVPMPTAAFALRRVEGLFSDDASGALLGLAEASGRLAGLPFAQAFAGLPAPLQAALRRTPAEDESPECPLDMTRRALALERDLQENATRSRESTARLQQQAEAAERRVGAKRPDGGAGLSRRDPDVVRAEAEEAEAALDQWRSALEAALAQVVQLAAEESTDAPADFHRLLRDLLDAHEHTAGREQCPVCGSPAGAAFLAQTRGWADVCLTSARARVAAGESLRGRVEAQATEAGNMVQEWETTLAARRQELSSLEMEARAAVLSAASLRDQPGPAELIRAAIADAEAKTSAAGTVRDFLDQCDRIAAGVVREEADRFCAALNGALEGTWTRVVVVFGASTSRCVLAVVGPDGAPRPPLEPAEQLLLVGAAMWASVGMAPPSAPHPTKSARTTGKARKPRRAASTAAVPPAPTAR